MGLSERMRNEVEVNKRVQGNESLTRTQVRMSSDVGYDERSTFSSVSCAINTHTHTMSITALSIERALAISLPRSRRTGFIPVSSGRNKPPCAPILFHTGNLKNWSSLQNTSPVKTHGGSLNVD